MADVVNLKRFKKRVARDQATKTAEANRLRFGQTKLEKISSDQVAKRANNLLDQHRRNGEEAS